MCAVRHGFDIVIEVSAYEWFLLSVSVAAFAFEPCNFTILCYLHLHFPAGASSVLFV